MLNLRAVHGPVRASSATLAKELDLTDPIDSTRGHVEDFAAQFARWSAGLQAETLPPEVLAAVQTNLLDTLGCAIAGHGAQGVGALASLASDWGGKPEATIWCTHHRVPAHQAAWVNGMMAHARDYDDTHDRAVLHAGVTVVPAAIAAAELNPLATGADLAAGIAAGLELVCRLGLAADMGPIEAGFIYTALLGNFAATAAAARVARLDATTTANALGITLSQADGTHQVTRDAALTKRMQPGFAARTGLVSVALAQAGITGAIHTFEGVDGLFNTYLRGRFDPQRLRAQLGERFELLDLSYKPYPCCRHTHTAIDAALRLRQRLAEPALDEAVVTVELNAQAYQAVCTPPDVRRAPATMVEAQFSIPFTVACALLQGHVELADFDADRLRDPAIRALTAKVQCKVGDDLERDWSRHVTPARITLETRGTVATETVLRPRGHPEEPMTRQDFIQKLASCLAASELVWPQGTAESLRQRVDGLLHLSSGMEVIQPLCSFQPAP